MGVSSDCERRRAEDLRRLWCFMDLPADLQAAELRMMENPMLGCCG